MDTFFLKEGGVYPLGWDLAHVLRLTDLTTTQRWDTLVPYFPRRVQSFQRMQAFGFLDCHQFCFYVFLVDQNNHHFLLENAIEMEL